MAGDLKDIIELSLGKEQFIAIYGLVQGVLYLRDRGSIEEQEVAKALMGDREENTRAAYVALMDAIVAGVEWKEE